MKGIKAMLALLLSKMTRQEIEALLRLLAEFEREELELQLQERRKVERDGRLH